MKKRSISRELAVDLDVLLIMKAFAFAHIRAHSSFMRYFGDGGTFKTPEEARVILESPNDWPTQRASTG